MNKVKVYCDTKYQSWHQPRKKKRDNCHDSITNGDSDVADDGAIGTLRHRDTKDIEEDG